MRVELLQGAEADLLETYVWLEERRIGLGEQFYRALDFSLEQMRRHPEIAPVYKSAYRRFVLRPFAVGIFYTISGQRLMVGAILDLRRDPEWITRRLLR